MKLKGVPTVPTEVSGELVMIGEAPVTVSVTASLMIEPEAFVTTTS